MLLGNLTHKNLKIFRLRRPVPGEIFSGLHETFSFVQVCGDTPHLTRLFGWVDRKRLHRLSWAETLAQPYYLLFNNGINLDIKMSIMSYIQLLSCHSQDPTQCTRPKNFICLDGCPKHDGSWGCWKFRNIIYFGILPMFYSSAEGYPYKTQGLFEGTLLI